MKSKTEQGLVWGGLLILFGVMSLSEIYTDLGPWVWVAVLAAAGTGIFGLYFSDQSETWLLIPGYTLWVIAGLILFTELNILRDESVAFYVLVAIAVPFLVVFLRNREQWWALIPAYVLSAVGLMVGLIGLGVLDDLLVPAYIMFAIAIPFFVVFTRDIKKWWALIPGGIMTIIGLSFLIAESAAQYIVPAALIIVGLWVLVRQFTRKEPDQPESIVEEIDESLAE